VSGHGLPEDPQVMIALHRPSTFRFPDFTVSTGGWWLTPRRHPELRVTICWFVSHVNRNEVLDE